MTRVVVAARTKSPDDTRDLAAAVAAVARLGDVLLLAGDLGAGKTVFAQGFGRGLGVTDAVTSPTFTLVDQHDGPVPFVHCDVYRLDHLQEVVDLGILELVDAGAVAIVEWGDAAAPVFPRDVLEVRIAEGGTDDERTLEVEPVGPSWVGRVDGLVRALEPWRDR